VAEGIQAVCRMAEDEEEKSDSAAGAATGGKSDLASLGSMLQARWKTGAVAETSKPQEMRAGQIRSFRITKLDRAAKQIELQLA
jgi:small subunit ribosomal protein S1